MNIKLENILNNIQRNMIEEYYPNSIIDKYSAKYNIVFNVGDYKYYYFYIWLTMYGVL